MRPRVSLRSGPVDRPTTPSRVSRASRGATDGRKRFVRARGRARVGRSVVDAVVRRSAWILMPSFISRPRPSSSSTEWAGRTHGESRLEVTPSIDESLGCLFWREKYTGDIFEISGM